MAATAPHTPRPSGKRSCQQGLVSVPPKPSLLKERCLEDAESSHQVASAISSGALTAIPERGTDSELQKGCLAQVSALTEDEQGKEQYRDLMNAATPIPSPGPTRPPFDLRFLPHRMPRYADAIFTNSYRKVLGQLSARKLLQDIMSRQQA